jgi:hypothetical protein
METSTATTPLCAGVKVKLLKKLKKRNQSLRFSDASRTLKSATFRQERAISKLVTGSNAFNNVQKLDFSMLVFNGPVSAIAVTNTVNTDPQTNAIANGVARNSDIGSNASTILQLPKLCWFKENNIE